LPISEVTTQVVEGKKINEFATEVPAQNYGSSSKTVDPIVQALRSNPKLSTIEKLVKAAGCKLVKKPYWFILENSGKVVTVSQVINYYGINTTSSVRCPICKDVFTYDLILFHLENSSQSSHRNLKPNEITKLFERRWYNWDYHNGHFWEAGEKIDLH